MAKKMTQEPANQLNTIESDLTILEPAQRTLNGRPPRLYTADICNKLCELVAEGNSMKAACEMLQKERFPAPSPNYRTVFKWLCDYQDFERAYARARLQYLELYQHDIQRIADECDQDTWKAARVKIEAREWLLERLNPDKYGRALQAAGNVNVQVVPVINIIDAATGQKRRKPTAAKKTK